MKIDILRCQEIAKNLEYDNNKNKVTFDLCGQGGRLKAKWLDSYMGLFEVEGQNGFVMAQEFIDPNIWCENISIDKLQL